MGKADLTDSQISAISNFAVKEQTDDEFFNEGQ
jgi:hypothetical protein